MIEKFRAEAAIKELSMSKWINRQATIEAMSAALEAAASATAEAEVSVTEEMRVAGRVIKIVLSESAKPGDMAHLEDAEIDDIYRAMHKARPKESGGSAACAAGVNDEAVKAGQAAHCCGNPECIRKVLEAALPYITGQKAGANPIKYKRCGPMDDYGIWIENERSGKDRRAMRCHNGRDETGACLGCDGSRRITDRRKPQGT